MDTTQATTEPKPRVAIIGAGPAGLSAAYALSKGGAEVEIFEAGNTIGGMSKTLELWGQKVDLGPHHFISSIPKVNDLWDEVLGDDYVVIKRLTRIFYNNRFFHYPLQPLNALVNLGPGEAVQCIGSYMKQWGKANPEHGTFEDWMVKQFGRRLFEIFFKTYSEKLWGMPCSQLDLNFARQRIKKLSLWEVLKEGVLQPTFSGNRSLAQRFIYPTKGAGMLYDRMWSAIKANGGKLYLNSPVTRLTTNKAGSRITGLALRSGHEFTYDHVISTMPLTMLVQALPHVPSAVGQHARELQFRNTTLVYLNVNYPKLFPDHWLYVHMPQLKMGRITNFRNWSPTLYGNSRTSVLALEYWSNDGDAAWQQDDSELIDLAQYELRSTGLIGRHGILGGAVERIHRCYPVYRVGYQAHLQAVQRYLQQLENLSVIGRYGTFKYNNQDHSTLMGLMAAENILLKPQTPYNLWTLDHNSDLPVGVVPNAEKQHRLYCRTPL